MLKKYKYTAIMVFKAKINDGIIGFLPSIALKIVHAVPLMFLWTVLANSGVDTGMSLEALLTYTYINMAFSNILNVQTMLSAWNYSGELANLFTRPYPILGQVVAHTVGSWIFNLAFVTPVLLIIAPFIGVNIVPAHGAFFISLVLCISLGFAIDLIFACFAIQLKGITWLVTVIRGAMIALFSGAVIPFRLLPFGLEIIFVYQPFGSLNSAPLSIFVGTANIPQVIITQITWNFVMWTIALLWFKKSKEKLVSYGG